MGYQGLKSDIFHPSPRQNEFEIRSGPGSAAAENSGEQVENFKLVLELCTQGITYVRICPRCWKCDNWLNWRVLKKLKSQA
jgi:hypothetical protein